MNTRLGDAFDIGWTLASVVNGWCGPRLLESYEAERHPIGSANRHAAMRHLDVHLGFAKRALAGARRAALGDRYEGSPVIVADPDPRPPRWSEWDYISSTWSGARPPSFLMTGGSALFSRFSKGLTLVDFHGDAGALASAATARGIPMQHLPITGTDGAATIRKALER